MADSTAHEHGHPTDSHGHGHSPYVAHHFDTPVQQFDSAKLGMWLFLSTEILLFGGLFCAYAVYRANHPEIFWDGHHHLDTTLGGINTAILIASSFTMAWAVRAAQLSQQKLLVTLLCITLLGGVGFLGIKYVEYKSKWEHGLLWAGKYAPSKYGHGDDHGTAHATDANDPNAHPADHYDDAAHDTAQADAPEPNIAGLEPSKVTNAATGPAGMRATDAPVGYTRAERAENLQIFFSIYFAMTGLHGLHVIIGMCIIGWLAYRAALGHFHGEFFTPVDLGGLYWHLVDLIWIFLFPLLYLIH